MYWLPFEATDLYFYPTSGYELKRICSTTNASWTAQEPVRWLIPAFAATFVAVLALRRWDRQDGWTRFFSVSSQHAGPCDESGRLLRWMPSSTTVIKKRNCRKMWRSRWKWCPIILWGWPLSLYKLKPWLNSEYQLMKGLLINSPNKRLWAVGENPHMHRENRQNVLVFIFLDSLLVLEQDSKA